MTFVAGGMLIYVVALALVAAIWHLGTAVTALLGYLVGVGVVLAIWQPWRARPGDRRNGLEALGDWGECALVAMLWPVVIVAGLAL